MNSRTFLAMLVSLLAFSLCFTSCGPSAAKQTMLAATSIEEVNGLGNKLEWLQKNAQSGSTYVVEVYNDEQIGWLFSFPEDLSYKDKRDINIILKGVGANRTIFHKKPGRIFNVYSGVTLVLDDNITLRGLDISSISLVEATSTGPLVNVFSGGTLIMNDGSIITGNWNASGNGGGVYVAGGGTFIMKGGTITGNHVRPIKPNFGASTKEKFVADADARSMGGGLYVSGEINFLGKTPSGTFTKTGGTITGYASDHSKSSNAVVAPDGNAINGFGHAIAFGSKESKAIDTTVGPETTLHFSNNTLRESRNEEHKLQETAVEPDETTIQHEE
jgi:hypothetical protein